MKRVSTFFVAIVLGSQALAFGQTGDANKVLADARAALGGEKKLASLKTLAVSGQSTRVNGETSMPPSDIELAFELPDKFMKKDVLANLGGMNITRTSGFNGDAAIDVVDQPPSGGNMVIRWGGPGAAQPGTTQTPEQKAAEQKAKLLASRQEFARFTLGMLAASQPAYPLTFSYGGVAESPDGKADIIDVKGEGDFAVRLFIDAQTHLPLMLSWMGKEPLVIQQTVGGPGGGVRQMVIAGGGGGHAQGGQVAGGNAPKTPEEMEKLRQDAAERIKAAEANRRTVEFRMYYGDYRDVDGIKVPFSLQRSIDGKPVEQVTFEKVKVNGKIDPKKFETK